MSNSFSFTKGTAMQPVQIRWNVPRSEDEKRRRLTILPGWPIAFKSSEEMFKKAGR
jgi:hypothetical protein